MSIFSLARSCVGAALCVTCGVMTISGRAGANLDVVHRAGPMGPVPSEEDAQQVMQRVGERVRAYYERFQSIICTEIVEQLRLTRDLTPEGRSRAFTFELRVEPQTAADGRSVEFNAVRTLRLIDGRPPRGAREPECMDPREAYSEPLMFLLPEYQDDYAFRLAGTDRRRGGDVLLIDYTAVRLKQPRVSWNENCFTVDAPSKGRLLVDPSTYEVVRVEDRLLRPVDVPIPPALLKRVPVRRLTLERADTTVRYSEVAFRDPDETVRLPASVETLVIVPAADMPRFRVRQSFREYRRFLTGARIR